MEESSIRSLVWEDPLEEGMATHSSILACEIAWTEEPGGLKFIDCKESDMIEVMEHAHTLCVINVQMVVRSITVQKA